MFPMQTLKTDIRKRILSVSKRLFLKKGFRETSTRDIAREAGINLLEEVLMHDLTEEEVRSVMPDYVQFEIIGWRKMIQI